MPKLTIFAGINGVGKSTLYNFQKCRYYKEYMGERVNPDEILQNFNGDWREARDIMKSGRIAIQKIKECLEENKSFNWETTILSHYVISKMKEAKEKGYQVDLYFIGTHSVENSLNRIAKRVENGGHGIPEKLVKARFEKQFYNVDRAMNIADTVVFHDNEKVMKIVGIFYQNHLVYKDERCEWMENIYKSKQEDKKFTK